ncbi:MULTISPECIES: GNAT family N-acetyltransferase [Gordonia]|uniref:Aminoglycoside N-acetyltransferase AAC(2')-Ic n=1 Tax=Gordonia cholesterolivorans TaxID=559625 RepID=A0ABN3HGP7_9ACTN
MRLRHSHELSAAFRGQLFAFLADAFDGDFGADDFDHALGGVHVIAFGTEDAVVGHASVVQRQLIVQGENVPGGRVLRTGYVEAVAVDAAYRRRGIGDALMHQVDGIVARAYDFGALGASDDGRRLYLRHCWERWSGPLGVLTQSGVQSTPDDEGAVLVLRTPETAEIDTDGRLICEFRRGDVW